MSFFIAWQTFYLVRIVEMHLTQGISIDGFSPIGHLYGVEPLECLQICIMNPYAFHVPLYVPSWALLLEEKTL